jgi:hypothetical protein
MVLWILDTSFLRLRERRTGEAGRDMILKKKIGRDDEREVPGAKERAKGNK